MRVTESSMNRNYLNNLHRSLRSLNASGQRLSSGRAFTKMSENVTGGTRALAVRTQLYKNQQVQQNVKTANEQFSLAETNLTSIEDMLNSVHEQTLSALNGTKTQDQLDIFANVFTNMKEQLLQFANSTYDDKYVFASTSNRKPPFSIDDDGSMCYNGVKVDDITKTEAGYVFGADNAVVPYTEDVYIDVGSGMDFSTGTLNTRTAFNTTVCGLECFGCGTAQMTYTDAKGNEVTETVSKNVYELLGEISGALKDGDREKLSALNIQMEDAMNTVISSHSNIGVRGNFLERSLSRLESEEYTLTEIQSNLEYIEDSDEIVLNQSLEYSWMLTLQYGSKVLPQSLMDFINI